MKIIVNKYEVTFANGTVKSVCAQSARDVALAEDSGALPIVVIVRKEVGITIETASPPSLSLVTTVTDAAAYTAGCRAYPAASTVLPSQEVIFSAVEVTGFTFVGWYRDGTLLNTALVAEIPVTPPATGTIATIEARFVAA